MPQNIDLRHGDPASPDEAPVGPSPGINCDDISNPLRRSLCRACNAPVFGSAPFCGEPFEAP